MIILYYQNSILKSEVVSENVHITEVLNHLTSLGHSIIFADGKHYSKAPSLLNKSVVHSHAKESFWDKTKKIVNAHYFRSEALLSLYFIKEVKLFLSALITIIRYRPELLYRRNVVFGSEYFLSRMFRIPCVKEVNSLDIVELRMRYDMKRPILRIFNWIEKNNLPRADRHIVVTEKLRDILREEYGVSSDKIVVIENGANTELFIPMDSSKCKRELNLDLTGSFICFVGGLAPWHGVDYLISAMPAILKEYPNAMALIIGEGLIKNKLLTQSLQLGISDRIIFTGRIPYEKVPQYIGASEVCVVPSRDIGVGLSSLKSCEYLACGKPVVASRIVGFEFIEKLDCGYLVEPESTEELAKAIIRLLGDPISKQRMGENGRNYVLGSRSWESVAKRVAAVCEITSKKYVKRQT